MTKRIVDMVVAGLLLAALTPFLLLIALLIRADSGGPSLYRQERVGRGGTRFQILKFRTMINTGANERQITVAGDRRITRIGKFLRSTKIDEVPQLINVLRGDMSLVGPRPEVPKYVELYSPLSRDIILSVRPGLTDEASIKFRKESELLAEALDPEQAYVQEILPQKVVIYTRYAQTHTLLGDMRILARTACTLVLFWRRDEKGS